MIEQRQVSQVADLLKLFVPEAPRKSETDSNGLDFQAMLEKSISKIENQENPRVQAVEPKIENTKPQGDEAKPANASFEPSQRTEAFISQTQTQGLSDNKNMTKQALGFLEKLEGLLRPKVEAKAPASKEQAHNFDHLHLQKADFSQQEARLEKKIVTENPRVQSEIQNTDKKNLRLEKSEKDEPKKQSEKPSDKKLEHRSLEALPQQVNDRSLESNAKLEKKQALDFSDKAQSTHEVAQKIIDLSKQSQNLPTSTVTDAMNLVRELSNKLGLTKPKSNNETEQNTKLDLRASRFDQLRKDRLEPSPESKRVELISNVRMDQSVQKQSEPSSLQGINSVRVERLEPSSNELKYSTLSPQVVMHHSISLPSDMSPTVSNFASVLKTQLREGLNNDVVGQAKIMLDTHGKGEIKLILHPENLGEVKIHLKLEESTVGGTILVDNKEVLEVFKDNMNDLLKAFEAGGLDASKLKLDLSSSGGQSGQEFAESDRRNSPGFTKYAVERLGESVPVVRFQELGQSQVNLIV